MTRLSLAPSTPAFFQNPYVTYRDWHAGRRAFYWEEYGHWCLAGFDEVFAAFRDRRLGRDISHVASREELGWPPIGAAVRPFWDYDASTLLSREPPAHTRLRGLVNRAFVGRSIERLRPVIAALTHDLVDRIEASGRADLIADFAVPIPTLVIAEFFGVPGEDLPAMLDWSRKMVAMYQFGRTAAVEADAVAATLAFKAYVRDLIRARQGGGGEDLLSTLIAVREAGDRLSDDELENMVILTLIAGHEATAHGIGNAIKTLLEHNADPAVVFAGDAATEAAVEECLRYDPPLHLFTRLALEDVEISGVSLKRGDSIGLLLGAANRDPRRWSEPDRFDPARPVQGHVAFGGGIHFCVGAPLARMEMAVALPILFARLPRLRLAEPPQYRDIYHFRGVERLAVTSR